MKQKNKKDDVSFLSTQKRIRSSKKVLTNSSKRISKKQSLLLVEKELQEVREEIKEMNQKVEDIRVAPVVAPRFNFFRALTYNVWFALLVFGVGIFTLVFGPSIFRNFQDYAQAGVGTESEPYTVCAEGCDYTTIQGALNASVSGGFVSVQSGYNPSGETIISFPTSTITLDCENSGAVIGEGSTTTTVLLSEQSVLQNCQLNAAVITAEDAEAGVSILGNTFTTTTPSSVCLLGNDWTVSNNIGLRSIYDRAVGGIENAMISNNTIHITDLGTGGFPICKGCTVTQNSIVNYSTDLKSISGGTDAENFTFSYNTVTFPVTPLTDSSNNKFIYMENTTNTIFTGNYFSMPAMDDEVADWLGILWITNPFEGEMTALDISITHNTFLMQNADMKAVHFILPASSYIAGGSAEITYNIFYNPLSSAKGKGISIDGTDNLTGVSFGNDYNGFYNLSSNIEEDEDLEETITIGEHSKTTNPYFKIYDADTSNNLHLAPFSDYLDVNGEEDIGAYSTARGSSFVIDQNGTIDYSNVHATSTGIIACARSGDTFNVSAGTYDPISVSSFDDITISGAGSETIFNGTASTSSLSLTNVTNSTFEQFVVQNASSTSFAYAANNVVYSYDGSTYGESNKFGMPANYTFIVNSNSCGTAYYGADGYNVSSLVTEGNDWHLALGVSVYASAKITLFVPNQYAETASELASECGATLTSIDAWVTSTFDNVNGVMTYNSSAVETAGLSVAYGTPSITETFLVYAGIKFAGASTGNTVSQVTSTANSYGVWFAGSSENNSVQDSVITNSSLYDIFSDVSGTNNIKNTFFTSASSSISGDGEINIYEKMRAYVIDGESNPISGASVLISSNDSTVSSTLGLTGADGYTSYSDYLWILISDATHQTGSATLLNPFSITAIKSGFSNKIQSATISSPNQTVTITMDDTPSDPTGLVVETTTSTMSLVFDDNSTNEVSFIWQCIEGSDISAFVDATEYTTASQTSSTVGSVTLGPVGPVTPNTELICRVKAVNEEKSSNFTTSSVAYTDPVAPVSPVASSNGQNSVRVSWVANSNTTSTVYEVYNVTNSAVVTSSTTSTSFTVTGLVANTSYDFKVRAQYRASSSLWTDYTEEASASTASVGANVTIEMSVGDEVGFELTSAGSHTITLNSISGDEATVTVASNDPEEVTVTVGGDSASANGVSVALNSITDGIANFTLSDDSGSSSPAPGGSSSGGSSYLPSPSLSGLVINGVTRAITNIPEVYVTFLGISSTVVEATISLTNSFENMSWILLNGPTLNFVLPDIEGLYTLYAKVRAQDGSTSVVRSAQVEYDKSVPVNPPHIVAPEENQVLTRLPIKITGMAVPHGTVEAVIEDTTYAVSVLEDGTFSISILENLLPGQYKVLFKQIDEKGNESEIVTRNFVYAKPAPVLPPVSKDPQTGDTIIAETDIQAMELSPNELPVDTTVYSFEELSDLFEELNTTREAFLLVVPQTGVSKTNQIGSIKAFAHETLNIVVRPQTPVHSITARLYKNNNKVMQDDAIELELPSEEERDMSLGEKIKNIVVPRAYASYQLPTGWVRAFVFKTSDAFNAYTSDIALKNLNPGAYKLVVSMNEKDGTRTHISKDVSITKKGVIRGETGKNIQRGIVKLFYKSDMETKTFEPWVAEEYGQKNPIVLSQDGGYAFSVPRGMYYAVVEAPGYHAYTSDIYTFDEAGSIAEDIVLRKKGFGWWNRFWEWARQLVQ